MYGCFSIDSQGRTGLMSTDVPTYHNGMRGVVVACPYL